MKKWWDSGGWSAHIVRLITQENINFVPFQFMLSAAQTLTSADFMFMTWFYLYFQALHSPVAHNCAQSFCIQFYSSKPWIRCGCFNQFIMILNYVITLLFLSKLLLAASKQIIQVARVYWWQNSFGGNNIIRL